LWGALTKRPIPDGVATLTRSGGCGLRAASLSWTSRHPARCLFFYRLSAMESIAVSTRCIDAPVRLADFDYHLPPELIAQTPTPERDRARMLVLNRALGTVTDTHVRTLPDHLQSGDLVVVNDTRVIPARVFGRAPSGGAIELLLIRSSRIVPLDQGPIRGGSGKAGVQWRCLGRPARRLRQGATLTFPL
jgi:hypothetical protein